MDIRKIGVVGAFAAGAALALAPLAAAVGDTDTPDPTTPPDFSHILSSEISSMNWLFQTQASMTNFDADLITKGGDAYPFDTVSKTDLLANEDFAKLLYGVNYETEAGSVPGSFSLFNGAITQFTDANNVLIYALMSGGDQIDADNYSDYLFGSDASITEALGGETVFEDFGNFFQNGVADLAGYFDIDLPALDV